MDFHRSRGHMYGVADEAKLLVDVFGIWDLVAHLHSLRYVSVRRLALTLALGAGSYIPTLSDLMESIWLKDQLSPDDVYNMMRIASAEPAVSSEGIEAYMQWLNYVERLNKIAPSLHGSKFVFNQLVQHPEK